VEKLDQSFIDLSFFPPSSILFKFEKVSSMVIKSDHSESSTSQSQLETDALNSSPPTYAPTSSNDPPTFKVYTPQTYSIARAQGRVVRPNPQSYWLADPIGDVLTHDQHLNSDGEYSHAANHRAQHSPLFAHSPFYFLFHRRSFVSIYSILSNCSALSDSQNQGRTFRNEASSSSRYLNSWRFSKST